MWRQRRAPQTACPHLPTTLLPQPTPPSDYVAAFTVDLPRWGRVRCQAFGFFMIFLLFLLCAALYNTLLDKAVWAFQVGGGWRCCDPHACLL